MKTALIVSVVLMAGCAESRITTPSGDSFDVAAAGRANATMTALVSGPGMSGVAALGGRMPAELSPSGSAFGSPMDAASEVPAVALRLLQSLPAAGGPRTVQVIRAAVLGHTYVYSPAAHRYVPDPARAGAPALGVRFILYGVDPVTHDPRVDQETGYADLTDDGAPGSGVGLRFRAVASGRTFLDYAFTLTPTLTGGSLHVSGFLADDQNRLDFTIGSAAQVQGGRKTAHVTFDLAVASQRFHATGSIDAEDPAGIARVDVVVAIGADAIRLTGESNASAVNAALTVNSRLFATITGDPRHPTVRGDGGRELTAAEIQVLGGLVGMVYGVIEMFEHLLEPVAALLGISVAL